MPRVVLDTNILVSAAVYGGIPQEALDRCRPPGFLQIRSPPLISELRRTLGRRFLWPERRIETFLDQIHPDSEVITPAFRLDVCRDPDDDRLLECAVAGQAAFIVTGDRDLLCLDPFRGIRILTVRQFFDPFPAGFEHLR